MSLKTTYKNDAFDGKRRYLIEDNGDGTWSIVDKTVYAVTGDIFNADDVNGMNAFANDLEKALNATNVELENIKRVHDFTLIKGGWSNTAPYKQRISISGMKETDAPTPGIIYPESMTEQQKQVIDKCSDMITDMETFNGYVEVTCKFKKPTEDLMVGLKGR